MYGPAEKAMTGLSAASKNYHSISFTGRGVVPLPHLPSQDQSHVLTAVRGIAADKRHSAPAEQLSGGTTSSTVRALLSNRTRIN